MKGIERPEVPWPPKPPGGKKRCRRCGEYKDCSRKTFGSVIHKRADGRRVRYWRANCRICENRARRAEGARYNSTWTPAETRARTRAVTRMIKLSPLLFKPLFVEELRHEYMKEGLYGDKLDKAISKRVGYLENYIRALENE